jgi:hypothetical protein
MRGRPVSSLHGNGPTAVLDHFRVKFGFSLITLNLGSTADLADGAICLPAVQAAVSAETATQKPIEFSRQGSIPFQPRNSPETIFFS